MEKTSRSNKSWRLYISYKKQDEVRSFSRRFKQDTRDVYTDTEFSALCDGEEKRPKYQIPISARTGGNDIGMFEDIEKVRSFLADLWEKSGNGNKDAVDRKEIEVPQDQTLNY